MLSVNVEGIKILLVQPVLLPLVVLPAIESYLHPARLREIANVPEQPEVAGIK